MRYLMIVLSMCLWANVAKAAEPKDLVGTEVSIAYMCISPIAFEDIFSKKTEEALDETAVEYEMGGSCLGLPAPVTVELKEYIKAVPVAWPEGIAYIYRIEGENTSYYTFLFEATQGV